MEGSKISPEAMQAQMEKAQAQEQQKVEMEEAKSAILQQLLTTEARERLSNIQAAKPEKAAQIESILIGNARAGRVQGKVSDEQLITGGLDKGFYGNLIDQLNEKIAAETTVTIKRKNMIDSDDDEDIDSMFS